MNLSKAILVVFVFIEFRKNFSNNAFPISPFKLMIYIKLKDITSMNVLKFDDAIKKFT